MGPLTICYCGYNRCHLSLAVPVKNSGPSQIYILSYTICQPQKPGTGCHMELMSFYPVINSLFSCNQIFYTIMQLKINHALF